MKRNYKLRQIKTKKSYSTNELAELLKVHSQTVRSWRKAGLKTIDDTSHYSLFLGSEVKSFLQAQAESRRIKLKADEFYCLTCGKAVTAKNAKLISQNKKIGKGKESMRWVGNCDNCGQKINKFASLQSNELAGGKIINTGLSSSL